MSEEIVRKLRENHKKMIFESNASDVDDILINEDKGKDSYYFVKYVYTGDELSDYQSTVIVKADSEDSALKKAKKSVKDDGARYFEIDSNMNFGLNGKFDSLEDYRKKFPRSNIKIFESVDIEVPEEETIVDSFSINVGVSFKNAGYLWNILATKGEYALVHSSDKKLDPYVVAWKIDTKDGSWAQGHYFSDKNKALEYLKRQSGILNIKESEDTEDTREYAKVCECGSTNFVKEGGKLVCDDCGRDIPKEEKLVEDSIDPKKSAALRKSLEYWSAGHYSKAVDLYKKYGVSDKEFAKALVRSLNESEDTEYEEDTVNEGRYTGTTVVRRTAEKVLKNHGLNNSTGKYDKFVNKMWNYYKETLLDEKGLESAMERHFKSMYPNIKESRAILPEDDELSKNIIRAVQEPINTSDKPSLDAAISEAIKSK